MPSRIIENRVAEELSAIPGLARDELVTRWEAAYGRLPPKGVSRRLLEYSAAYQVQANAKGSLKPALRRKLRSFSTTSATEPKIAAAKPRGSSALPAGTRLVREWHGRIHSVHVRDDGFEYDGCVYVSLSKIAREITGARWSGPRFFGL